jgi:hypothetical protein
MFNLKHLFGEGLLIITPPVIFLAVCCQDKHNNIWQKMNNDATEQKKNYRKKTRHFRTNLYALIPPHPNTTGGRSYLIYQPPGGGVIQHS